MERAASQERYIPAAQEPYMSEGQIAYFRRKLTDRKEELAQRLSQTIKRIKSLESVQADILDRSNFYIELEREVNTFERYSTVLDQIEQALNRIEDGSFGYCELTGCEIGLRRLEAVPFAAMSIQAVEEYEARQKHMTGGPARQLVFS